MKRIFAMVLAMTALNVFAEMKLVKADPSKVCMIQNRVYPTKQTAVKADGKTYYACCAACRHRLTTDPDSRIAIDPFSRKAVDKSKAVIGAQENGNILFFESEANMKAFAAKAP
jgi:YHS domain-containing protein